MSRETRSFRALLALSTADLMEFMLECELDEETLADANDVLALRRLEASALRAMTSGIVPGWRDLVGLRGD